MITIKFEKLGSDFATMYKFKKGKIYVIQKKNKNNKYIAKIGWDWENLTSKEWYEKNDILCTEGNLNEIARYEIKQIYISLKNNKKKSKKLNDLKIALAIVHQDLSTQKLF